MSHFVYKKYFRRSRFPLILLIGFLVLFSSAPPCAATIFTGSISRSDPPSAVLVARFNFREYSESKYSVQASNTKGFFALFDDETQMLLHLEKGLRSSSSNECMSYLMDGKGVGPYRALPPPLLERGWSEGITGHYCRDWFFVFFNCQASLEVPSYRIETTTDGGSQLPCGKESLPSLLVSFAVLCIIFTAFLLQKHGRVVFNLTNSCCFAMSGCAVSGIACVLMGFHYFRMRSDGTGSQVANLVGRIMLQGAQVTLFLHALRFSSFLSLPRIWSSFTQSRIARTALPFAAAAYGISFILSLMTDSSESVVSNAQPLNKFGVPLTVFQFIFAAVATIFYRRALLLQYADTSFKLQCFSLMLALPWLWFLPLGTLLCLTVGSKDQLVAVYAVQLSLSTVYSIASALVLADYVPEDDPELPRFFDDGL